MVEVRLFRDIEPDTLDYFMDALKDVPDGEEVVIQIASDGGFIFTAFAVIDYLYRRGFKTKAEIYGLSASAASLIALSCDIVEISEFGSMMLHSAYNTEYKKDPGVIRANEVQLQIIHRRNPDYTLDDLSKDKWYSARECLDMGFADRLLRVDDNVLAACNRYLAKALISHKGGLEMDTNETFEQDLLKQADSKDGAQAEIGEGEGEKEMSLTDIIEALAERVDRLEARIGELEKGRAEDAQLAECGGSDAEKQQARLKAIYARVTQAAKHLPRANGEKIKAKADVDKAANDLIAKVSATILD